MKTTLYRRLFGGLLILSLCFLLVTYLLLPTRSFSDLLGGYRDLAQNFYGLALFAEIAAVTLLFLLFNLYSDAQAKSVSEARSDLTGNATARWINLALIALILVRVSYSLNGPLDVDENVHAHALAEGRVWQELNPIPRDPKQSNLQNHVLPQLFSVLSVKAFGLNKLAFRFPSFFFTLMLLVSIYLLAPMAISPFTLMLVLLHFGFNAMAEWYFHSTRGYVAMMLFTAIPFLIVLRYVRSPETFRRYSLILFSVSLGLAAFTHIFAILFNGILVFSLLCWLNLNKNLLSTKSLEEGKKFIGAGILMAPLFTFILANNLIFLHRLGDLGAASPPDVNQSLLEVLGFSYTWQAKLLSILMVALVISAWHKGKKFRSDFCTLFMLGIVGFVGAAVFALHVRILEPRFLLAFVCPLIVWVGEMVNWRGWTPTPLVGRVAAIIALVLLPIVSAKPVYTHLTLNVAEFDDFIRSVRRLSAPIKENCYSFSGKADFALWAKNFYFSDANREPLSSCKKHFHLDLSPRADAENFGEVPSGNRTIVYRKEDMTLYQIF